MLADLEAEKNSLFYSCVQNCHEPIMILDLEGTLLYVNPAWESTYQYTSLQAIGQNVSLIESEKPGEPHAPPWLNTEAAPPIPWQGEVVHRSQAGRRVHTRLTVTPYILADETAGYMVMATNLTEQKRLEAQIAKQDRLATIGELTSGLAHEIGTPIGVIRGRAEMLTMFLDKDDSRREELAIIIKQADRIAALINTLLRLSRSPEKVNMSAIPVRPVLDEALLLLDQKIKKYKISVQIAISEGIKIYGEANRLEQIFINLIMNATAAIQKRSQPSAPGKIDIAISEQSQEVLIRVTDNGCGIEPQNLDKIFDPFFTTKAAGEGTGLGLSIVVRVVSEMAGRIAVASTPNQGSTFSVALPKPQPQVTQDHRQTRPTIRR